MEFFVKCKSNDIKSSIYTIMAKLMSDNVTIQYSWTDATPFRKIAQNKFNI